MKTEEERKRTTRNLFFSQDGERKKQNWEPEGAAAACFHSNVDAGQERERQTERL